MQGSGPGLGGSSQSLGPADSHCKSVLWEIAASPPPTPPTPPVDKDKSDMCSKVNERSRPPTALTSIVLEQDDAEASMSPRQRWTGWSLVLRSRDDLLVLFKLFFTLSTQNSEFCLQSKVHSWRTQFQPSQEPRSQSELASRRSAAHLSRVSTFQPCEFELEAAGSCTHFSAPQLF